MASICSCVLDHPPKLVVLTGGPGAGKTAVLEVAQRDLCRHVVILPEAASILWRGQFPRHPTTPGRKAAQRAIVRIQLEMQRMTVEEGHAALIVCDRGTLDGLAYWPGSERAYFDDIASTKERELARYAAVIHLQTPTLGQGYVTSQYRIESADEAAAIDRRIAAAWSGHPRRVFVPSDHDFHRQAAPRARADPRRRAGVLRAQPSERIAQLLRILGIRPLTGAEHEAAPWAVVVATCRPSAAMAQ